MYFFILDTVRSTSQSCVSKNWVHLPKKVFSSKLSKRRETRLCHYSASFYPNYFILSGRRSHFDRLLLYDWVCGAASKCCRCICGHTTYLELWPFVTRFQKLHNSFIFYPISLILSEYDRILAGWYHTMDNSGLHLKKSGSVSRNTIFLKKKSKPCYFESCTIWFDCNRFPWSWVHIIGFLSTFSAHFVSYISEWNKYLNFQV